VQRTRGQRPFHGKTPPSFSKGVTRSLG
jgi:hypothetical protein